MANGRGKRAWYWVASLSLAMTSVANGRGKRTLDWIASRFRASTLAMTGNDYLGFNGLSVIFINKCVLMCGMSLRTRQDDE